MATHCEHNPITICDICQPRSHMKKDPAYNEQPFDGMMAEKTVKRFAFDVDGTLIKKTGNGDEPRYEIIQMAKTLSDLGHTVFVWSGGGEDYALNWARKLGLYPKIRILPKSKTFDIDVAFDDNMVELAKINVIV